jgi:hypothetical protein
LKEEMLSLETKEIELIKNLSEKKKENKPPQTIRGISEDLVPKKKYDL